MKTLQYKGYQASVEFEDGALFIKVLHINDLLIAEVDRASDAQAAFQKIVDSYLADCVEEGRDPSLPFKGSFNVRVSPDLHRQIAMLAADEGISLNKWICDAMETKLQGSSQNARRHGLSSVAKQVASVSNR